MKVLITGSKGQLGSEIKELSSNYEKIEFIFCDLPELDICNTRSVNDLIIGQNINLVINCAAYTDVDKAEENFELANQVNVIGVTNIVNALKKINGKLIHISTDYVFDGNSSLPYKESDLVSPVGVYGETKRAGELVLIKSNIDAILIRTSWLYSTFGKNFVKTMLNLGTNKELINVVSDQFGTPTYANDLAKICLDIVSISEKENISKKGKIYHYSNEGVTSWYHFAALIMEIAGVKCKVDPIQTKDYPTPAKRPYYSVLSKKKIKNDFKIDIPHWENSLKKCILKLQK